MAATPTVNSRLRVLIAKTFRAEKLYSSIRSPKGEKLSSVGNLGEMANDIRAKEWERSHYQLRMSLNDILALGSNSSVLAEILQLRERFFRVAEESSAAVDSGIESLVESARRHEFAHAFKLCLELVRHKSRAQAHRVITDELSAILESSGRTGSALAAPAAAAASEAGPGVQPPRAPAEQPRSNVIPLRRKFASGSNSGF